MPVSSTAVARVPMMLPRPFRWRGDQVAVDLPGAHVLFTTRRGGVSRPPYDSLNLGWLTDDDPGAVRENHARVAGIVGLLRERLVHGRQVHGTTVARVTRAPDPRARAPGGGLDRQATAIPPDADGVDGQATALSDLAAVVLVADCLPVAVAGEGAVAMLHAGWRGLADGILGEGVAALRELGVRGELSAAIGPGAGGCCYETGDQVRARFAPARTDGRRLDLKGVARDQLGAAGVAAVHDVELCTLCADEGLLFSHRRDGGRTGRQAGIAWRSSSPA